ncbi:MAG: DUF4369 domain-containing protein [Bacteroidota bacterium]
MKNAIGVFSCLILLLSCAKKTEDLMQISGDIDGLKKGVLYLKKVEDSSLITLDSIALRGNGIFSFEYELEHPELFYLYLEKADNNDVNDFVSFFGEVGEISINSTWNQFDAKANINGSKSHVVYASYRKMMSDFNKRDLELAQAAFSEQDSLKIDSIEVLAERNFINRYRYLLNFGLTHPNSYVTPYVALTDGTEANPIYLDSIFTVLSEEVANSKYGRALERHLKAISK